MLTQLLSSCLAALDLKGPDVSDPVTMSFGPSVDGHDGTQGAWGLSASQEWGQP